MDRPIEFRRVHFFDEEKTKFSHFTYWGVNIGIGGATFTSPSSNNYALYFKDEQFTGLLDKNGVKIFEGDITKSIHNKMISSGISDCDTDIMDLPEFEKREYFNQIDWFEGVKISGWRIKGRGFQTSLKWSTIGNMGLVVVGNIHKNPELLKQAKK